MDTAQIKVNLEKIKDKLLSGHSVEVHEVIKWIRKADLRLYIVISLLVIFMLAYPYALSTSIGDPKEVHVSDWLVAVFSIFSVIGSLTAGLGTMCLAYFAFSFRNDWKTQKFIDDFMPEKAKLDKIISDFIPYILEYRNLLWFVEQGEPVESLLEQLNIFSEKATKYSDTFWDAHLRLLHINAINPNKEHLHSAICFLGSAKMHMPQFKVQECRTKCEFNEDGQIENYSVSSAMRRDNKKPDANDVVRNAAVLIKMADEVQDIIRNYQKEVHTYVEHYI
ncbi:TPA: hypothetical protein ACPHRY_002695 [Vibrio antiquarius]